MLDRDTGSVEPGSRHFFGSVSGSENHFLWFLVLYLYLRYFPYRAEPILGHERDNTTWIPKLIGFFIRGKFPINQEFPVSARLQLALITPLPFVHAAHDSVVMHVVGVLVRLGICIGDTVWKLEILLWFSEPSNLYRGRARRATYQVSSTTLLFISY